jgi:hypothetical protein
VHTRAMRSRPRSRLRLAAIALGALAVVAAAVAYAGRTRGKPPVDAGVPDASVVDAPEVAGGAHVRIGDERGAVHVWTPPGFEADTAGIVLYVHGYYTDVDAAWAEHGLAAQFAASRRNALFIVPEAPKGARPAVHWPSLGELIRTVRARLGIVRPGGPVVALGHSGAYRTLIPWLAYPGLDHLVLLDAMYGEEDAFRDWLLGSPARRMTVIGADTLRWTEMFVEGFPEALVLDRIPDDAVLAELGGPPRGQRLVYLRSQLGHMPIVTSGEVIPLLLRMTALPALAPTSPP